MCFSLVFLVCKFELSTEAHLLKLAEDVTLPCLTMRNDAKVELYSKPEFLNVGLNQLRAIIVLVRL